MSKTRNEQVSPDDWLMVEYYRKIGSKYGCKLCEKTHFTKDCKYLKDRGDTQKKPEEFSYTKMYSSYEKEEEETYGW